MKYLVALLLLGIAGCVDDPEIQSADSYAYLTEFQLTGTDFAYAEWNATADGAVRAFHVPEHLISSDGEFWFVPSNDNVTDILAFVVSFDGLGYISDLYVQTEVHGNDEVASQTSGGAWDLHAGDDASNVGIIVSARGSGTFGLALAKQAVFDQTLPEYLERDVQGSLMEPIANGTGINVGVYSNYNSATTAIEFWSDDMKVTDHVRQPTEPAATIRDTEIHSTMDAPEGIGMAAAIYWGDVGTSTSTYELSMFGESVSGTKTSVAVPTRGDPFFLIGAGSGPGDLDLSVRINAQNVNQAELLQVVTLSAGLSTKTAFDLTLHPDVFGHAAADRLATLSGMDPSLLTPRLAKA